MSITRNEDIFQASQKKAEERVKYIIKERILLFFHFGNFLNVNTDSFSNKVNQLIFIHGRGNIY